MSSPVKASKWQKLPSFPFPYFSQPVFINKDEFIVCPSKHSSCLSDGIYLFNTKQKNWRKMFNFPPLFRCFARSTAYHSKTSTLFVSLLCSDYLLKFDLNAQKLTQFIYEPSENHAKLLMIEDELHAVLKNEHCIFNVTQNQIKPLYTLVHGCDNPNFHHLIYLKSQKCLLLFDKKKIHRFSILNKKWKPIRDLKLPQEIGKFGVVTTRDERYTILFGGGFYVDTQGYLDSIYIYDIINHKFRKSKIKCPITGRFHATIGDDADSDKMVVFGFINNCYKEKDFTDLQVLPYYLIELISKWYQQQQVYLLRRSDLDPSLFTINVDDILR